MYLYYIAFRIEPGYFSHDDPLDYSFLFNTRFICNYLSKKVRKHKIQLQNPFSMLCVSLDNREYLKESQTFHVIDSHLEVQCEEITKYRGMTSLIDRYEWYLSLLERGYRLAADTADTGIPFDTLKGIHDSFRNEGYKNEWLFKKIIVKEYGLTIYLKCYFTTFDFRLTLEAYNINQTILITTGVILRTLPDEVCFDKDFRKVEVRNNLLIIKDFLDLDTFVIRLDLLADGIFNLNDNRGYGNDVDYYLNKIIW